MKRRDHSLRSFVEEQHLIDELDDEELEESLGFVISCVRILSNLIS